MCVCVCVLVLNTYVLYICAVTRILAKDETYKSTAIQSVPKSWLDKAYRN